MNSYPQGGGSLPQYSIGTSLSPNSIAIIALWCPSTNTPSLTLKGVDNPLSWMSLDN